MSFSIQLVGRRLENMVHVHEARLIVGFVGLDIGHNGHLTREKKKKKKREQEDGEKMEDEIKCEDGIHNKGTRS